MLDVNVSNAFIADVKLFGDVFNRSAAFYGIVNGLIPFVFIVALYQSHVTRMILAIERMTQGLFFAKDASLHASII